MLAATSRITGKNSLRSPALCLGELAAAAARRSDTEPLAAGEVISTGTLTSSVPIAPGERWTVEVDGIDLGPQDPGDRRSAPRDQL